MEEILNSHKVDDLKKEISNTNIKGYSKMTKKELVKLMLKTPEKFSHMKKKVPAPKTKRAPKTARVPKTAPESAYERQMKDLIPGLIINADRDLPDRDSLKDMNKLQKKLEKDLQNKSLTPFQRKEIEKGLKNTKDAIIIIKNTFPKFTPDPDSLKDMKKFLKIQKWKFENSDKYNTGNKNELKRTIQNIEERIQELKRK